MPRKRNLSPNFFKNEALSDIDPLGRIFFQGLWCFADRNGNLEHRPKRLKAEILPYDATVEDATTWLKQLASKLLISFYQVDGNEYIHITSFIRYQSPHPDEKSVFPEPPEVIEQKGESGESGATQKQVEAEPEQIQQDTKTTCEQVADNLENGLQQSSYSLTCILNTKEDMSNKPSPDLPESESLPMEPLKPDKHSTQVSEVFDYWKIKHNHPRSILDAKRRRIIIARLKEGFSVDRLKIAIDGCKNSAYHQGQNNSATVYDGIDLILRDASHVERFIAYATPKDNTIVQNQKALLPANLHRAMGVE